MLKIQNVKLIDIHDWNECVQEIYGKPYNLQQQDDCMPRGILYITVPPREVHDYKNDTIPEVVNGEKMGVSFKAWLDRDPKQELDTDDEWERENGITLFWERSFYPSLEMVVNDLYLKGLIPQGEYAINIDW